MLWLPPLLPSTISPPGSRPGARCPPRRLALPCPARRPCLPPRPGCWTLAWRPARPPRSPPPLRRRAPSVPLPARRLVLRVPPPGAPPPPPYMTSGSLPVAAEVDASALAAAGVRLPPLPPVPAFFSVHPDAVLPNFETAFALHPLTAGLPGRLVPSDQGWQVLDWVGAPASPSPAPASPPDVSALLAALRPWDAALQVFYDLVGEGRFVRPSAESLSALPGCWVRHALTVLRGQLALLGLVQGAVLSDFHRAGTRGADAFLVASRPLEAVAEAISNRVLLYHPQPWAWSLGLLPLGHIFLATLLDYHGEIALPLPISPCTSLPGCASCAHHGLSCRPCTAASPALSPQGRTGLWGWALDGSPEFLDCSACAGPPVGRGQQGPRCPGPRLPLPRPSLLCPLPLRLPWLLGLPASLLGHLRRLPQPFRTVALPPRHRDLHLVLPTLPLLVHV